MVFVGELNRSADAFKFCSALEVCVRCVIKMENRWSLIARMSMGGNGGNNWEHGFLSFRIFEHSEGLVLDLWIFESFMF